MLECEEGIEAPVRHGPSRCHNSYDATGFFHAKATVWVVAALRTSLSLAHHTGLRYEGQYARTVIDLHTHSSYSDGSDTPTQLAERAAKMGLSAIALTDHDTTSSYEEMSTACAHYGIEHIAGVEVSLRDIAYTQRNSEGVFEPINVHVLAYFVPLGLEHPLQHKLVSLRFDRGTRNVQLVALLNELGFTKITLDYLVDMVGNVDSIGRPHFAKAMFELHPEIVGARTDENWSKVFTDYLGKGGHAYIPKTTMTIEEFVESAQGANVVLSIAHPLVNYVTSSSLDTIAREMPNVLSSLRDRGFKGVEAYYGGTNARTRDLMVRLTRDAGMIPTGGSDYHGTFKLDVQLGVGKSGDLRVPYSVLDELRAARH